ncbi:site-specific integrase [Skermanella mucosa]|uniref:site-specific integrase n=1 Tax=Skermanella mucosa TaxID=1789672 RepID=UPI00192B91FC|nr:tyrosine-type recombinase/integrase [Skermanella mucosa]UEM18454.1 site-specific integrase [Skermanella mucosa]
MMGRINTIVSRDHLLRDCASWPADQQARWLAAFDPDVGKVRWVRQTQYQNGRVYSRYLNCAVRNGLPPRVTAAGVRAFVRGCEAGGASARTVSGYLWSIFKVMRVLDPVDHLDWLYRSCLAAQEQANLTVKRKSAIIAPAEEILNFALQLIGEARQAGPRAGWHVVQAYRDGLFIAVGIAGPERLRALAGIRIADLDTEVGIWHVPQEQHKTRRIEVRTYPDLVLRLLREWIDVWRPVHAGDHDALWIAKGGGPAGQDALAHAMRSATSRAPWGYPITPHRLRDAAATLLVRESPAVARLAQILLGHRSEATTREYTETAKRLSASRDVTRIMSAAHAAVGRRLRVAGNRDRRRCR